MIKTIEWAKDSVVMVDQRELPGNMVKLKCSNYLEIVDAIKKMAIRGAPAIGAAAAYGLALAAQNINTENPSEFIQKLEKAKFDLSLTRPTAVNLFWALEEVWKVIEENKYSINKIREMTLLKAKQIAEKDVQDNYMIGENGVELFDDEDSILTHCNAGSLATVYYGTALGVIRSVYKKKKKIKVFADETRPVLQGARLTAWELQAEKIPVTLICDSVAGFLMFQKKINKVIVGADRIASNGDVANKIGTYSISVLARVHKIPFYVAAPFSTIDFSITCGDEIPIEERNKDEVISIMGYPIAPVDVNVYNPAFDITPSKNISAIITEKGIIKPPISSNLKKFIINN